MKTSFLLQSDPRARIRVRLETVDCELCDRRFVPHLLDMPDGELIGLCQEHFSEYTRLWLEASHDVSH